MLKKITDAKDFTATVLVETGLELTKKILSLSNAGLLIILSNNLATQDVKLTSRKDATSLADLPVFKSGMKVATRQMRGQSAYKKD